MARNFFDQFDPPGQRVTDPERPNFFDQFDEGPSREVGFFEEMGSRLARGANRATQAGAVGAGLIGMEAVAGAEEQAARAREAEPLGGGYQHLREQYATKRGEMAERGKAIPGMVAKSFLEDEADIARYPVSPETERAIREISEAPGFIEAVVTAIKNPRAVTAVTFESLPISAPILALGGLGFAVGGPAGGAAGGGFGSFAVEFSFSLSEAMREKGVDLTDEQAVADAFNNPEIMEAARTRAIQRGIPIAAFDALSFGIAGKLAGPAYRATGGGKTGMVAGAATETAAQAAAGGAGEAGAQLASEGRISSPGEVVLEAAAEIPGAVTEPLAKGAPFRRGEAPKDKTLGDLAGEQGGQPPPPGGANFFDQFDYEPVTPPPPPGPSTSPGAAPEPPSYEGGIDFERVEPQTTFQTEPGAAPDAEAGVPFVSPKEPIRAEAEPGAAPPKPSYEGGIDYDGPGGPPPLKATTERPDEGDRRVKRAESIRRRDKALGEVKLPKNFDDPRLKRESFREGLTALANELQKGVAGTPIWGYKEETHFNPEAGDMPGGDFIVGRMASPNPEWFKNNGWSVDQAKNAVDAALAGELYEESAYDPEWDAETRTLADLAEDAAALAPEETQAILEKGANDAEVASALYGLIAEKRSGQIEQRTDGEGAATQEEPKGAAEAEAAPVLETYTEKDLAEREAAKQAAKAKEAEAEQKAKADEARKDFALTGSESEADKAISKGAAELFDARGELAAKADVPKLGGTPVTGMGDKALQAWLKTSNPEKKAIAQAEIDRRARESEGRQKETSADVTKPQKKETTSEEPKYSKATVTESAAFKKWFKDSKVVDENGEPLVVYHGTSSSFETFDTDKEGAHFGTREAAMDRLAQLNEDEIEYDLEQDEDGWWVFVGGEGTGPFDTAGQANKWIKSQPKHPEPMPVYLSINNPLRIPDLGTWSFNGVHSYLSTSNKITKAEADEAWEAWNANNGWEKLKEILSRHGYDGFVYENEQEDEGSDSYIAFRPEQIKSAIGNRGTFDPNDPNILRSQGKTTSASTPAQIRTAVDEAFGKGTAARLEKKGILRVDESHEDPTVKGYYDGQVAVLVAGNLLPSEARGVLLHEIGVHHGLRGILGDKLYDDVLRQVEMMDKAGNAKVREAKARVPKDTPKGVVTEETVAYLVEHHPNMSIVQRIYRAIRAFLFKMGLVKNIQPGDIVSLAQSAVRGAAKDATVAEAAPVMRSEKAPAFYSQMQRVLADKLPGKGTPSSMKQAIQAHAKKGLFKAEELEWSGVEEWLDSIGPRKVTKGEVLDFLAANEIRVEEVELGGKSAQITNEPIDPDTYPDKGADQGEAHKNLLGEQPETASEAVELTYGGDKYRAYKVGSWWEIYDGDEWFARGRDMPQVEQAIREHFGETSPVEARFEAYTLAGAKEGSYRELLLTLPEEKNDMDSIATRLYGKPYEELSRPEKGRVQRQLMEPHEPAFFSGHFDEPNVLAHVRFNERTDADGKRVLFVEEVQGDAGQELRKLILREIEKEGIESGSKQHAIRYQELLDEWRQGKHPDWKVPPMPFVGKTESWSMLVMKRMIRYASENGFDKIAWTTGEQQAERYDLSKQVGKIVYYKDGTLSAYRDADGPLNRENRVIEEMKVPKEKLADYIGKEAADRILNNPTRIIGGTTFVLEGDDLKIGGTGIKTFYDKMLPSMVNKYVKKWGAKVGSSKVPIEESAGSKYVGSTPTLKQMREVQEISDRAGRPVYESPITGERQTFQINRVSIHRSVTRVLKEIESGATFQQAMADHGNQHLAEIFGGEMEAVKLTETEPVHSLDITPAMRESVMQGQPLFSRRDGGIQYEGGIDWESPIPGTSPAPDPGGLDAPPPQNDGLSDAQRAALGKIAPPRTVETARQAISRVWKNAGTRIRQGVADQYASILKEIGEREWKLARMTHTATGALEAMFADGSVFLDEDGALDVNTDDQSLVEVFRPLGPELERFLGWVAGNRAERLKEEDREHLFSDEDIAALKSLNLGQMDDGRDRSEVYATALEGFNRLGSAVLDIAERTGLIDAEERATWDEQFYVPFYRVLQEGVTRGPRNLDALANQTAYKRLKGADIPLNDLLSNTLMNWSHLLSASLRNQAGVATMDKAVGLGIAEEVDAATRSDNAVFIRRDGKRVWYEVSEPLVLESITALSYDGWNNPAMKTTRWFKRAFTFGVTMNPEFMIANLIRDTIHAMAVSELDVKTAGIGNVIQGFRGVMDKELRAHMLAGGGEVHFGHFYGADPEAARNIIKRREIHTTDIIHNTGALSRLKRLVPGAIDFWRETGSKFENVNRAALYQQLRDKGYSHFEASFAARDLMDFSQGGTFAVVRFLTQAVPFLNARIQGLDKAYRAGKSQPGKLAAVVGVVVLAHIALYLKYRDDDDFKKREDWDRDTYYWFKIGGQQFRIPKPFEVGVVGTLAERLVEQIVDDEAMPKDFLARVEFALLETFAFDPTPQIALPVVEVWANKSHFTGRSIESIGMKRRSPAERRRYYTSEASVAASRGMSKVLPDKLTLSPVQIEHLVKGYFGWLGSAALDVVDQPFRAFEPSRPEMRPQDYPVVGRFVREEPARNTRYTEFVYEALNEVRQIRADELYLRRLGEYDRANDRRRSEADKMRHRHYLEQQAKKLSLLNRQMMKIRFSATLSPVAKRERIDTLIGLKNTITKRAYDRISDSFR